MWINNHYDWCKEHYSFETDVADSGKQTKWYVVSNKHGTKVPYFGKESEKRLASYVKHLVDSSDVLLQTHAEWFDLSHAEQRKLYKEKVLGMYTTNHNHNHILTSNQNSVVHVAYNNHTASTSVFDLVIIDDIVPAKEQGTKTMDSDTTNAKYHLRNRVNALFSDKYTELQLKFFIIDNPPKTLGEALERIKNGEYRIKRHWKLEDTVYPSEFGNAIHWATNDPDQKGFGVAVNSLTEEKDNTLDKIAALSPAEGLKALESFKSYMPSS